MSFSSEAVRIQHGSQVGRPSKFGFIIGISWVGLFALEEGFLHVEDEVVEVRVAVIRMRVVKLSVPGQIADKGRYWLASLQVRRELEAVRATKRDFIIPGRVLVVSGLTDGSILFTT